MHAPKGALVLDYQVFELVGVGAAATPGNRFEAIGGAPRGIFLDEGVVASLFDARGNLVDGVVPGNVFPIGAAGPAHLRSEEAPFVHDVLLQGSAFGAERAAIDGMVDRKSTRLN